MSMLSKNLEKSLHRAFALAGERRHEYATLEHLLLAMTEDEDATPVLKACGVDPKKVKTVNVLEDDEIRAGIKDYSNWPTIPQLYVKGEFIGGSDIMMEMYESGELLQVLGNKAA